MGKLGIFLLRVLVGWWNGILSLLLPVSGYLPRPLQRTIDRELRLFVGFGRLGIYYLTAAGKNRSAAAIFERVTQANPENVAFKYNDRDWTFRQIDNYANQVAHFFQSEMQFKKGDCVALIATSCPQYVAFWLGLNKIGCVTALINFNLKEEALRHAITSANAKVVVVGAELMTNYRHIQSALKTVQKSYEFSEGNSLTRTGELPSFDDAIAGLPTSKPVVAEPPGFFDKVIYIYTSGTTGLPKPCVITTFRIYTMTMLTNCLSGLRKDDVILCTLPLYHGAGGVMNVGQALFTGATVVLKKNFSASQFWNDVRKYKCTVFQYIGELCRYLLVRPPSPTDTQHSIRLMMGIGLRPQIWTEFVKRFGIARVVEFYGCTEGNVVYANVDGHVGSIGFTSRFLEWAKPQRFIKIDLATNEPIRDEKGFCISAGTDEPCEMVGQITKSKLTSFDGYIDKAATNKKHLANVFETGDLYFRTGDIVTKDKEGYIYFLDRAGDTYRWRGENVSTTEVEGTMSRLLNDVDVAVFGVSVPGCEGKAGMAAIASSDASVDFAKLSLDVSNNLASFARPLFLRFQPRLEVTGTFKIMKTALKEAGFDVTKCGGDPLYYYDPATAVYRPLTAEVYQRICTGQIRY